ncbi:MAG: anti-sigma factor [Vicinamibacterales bacterium]
MPGQGTDVIQEVSEVERRLSELQAQIDRLSLSLHLWSEKQERRQLGHAAQEDSMPIQDLRNLIAQEWSTLRQLQEEPVKGLREQTSNLTQISVAAASSTVSGFERTEARLAALEASFHTRLSELSDQIQAMVAEVRAVSRGQLPPAPAEPATSWPLEDVVRLHSQLRDGSAPTTLPARAASEASSPALQADQLLLPPAPAALVGRMETLERDLAGEQTRIKETDERGRQNSRMWRVAIAALLIVAVVGGFLVSRLQQQLSGAEARVAEAESLAAATAQSAADQLAAARQEVDRNIAEANAAALKAETISDVLAAPDLVRYNLIGDPGSASRGQTIFSRSRGLVFTGSRLPALPAGSRYQIWLLTPSAAHSAGLFVPDAAGRFTMASDEPPTAPPPIVGVSVTVEPEGGSSQPTGQTILARVPSTPGPS